VQTIVRQGSIVLLLGCVAGHNGKYEENEQVVELHISDLVQ